MSSIFPILVEKAVINYIMNLTPFLRHYKTKVQTYSKVRFGWLGVFSHISMLLQIIFAFIFIGGFLTSILTTARHSLQAWKSVLFLHVISTNIIQPNIAAANKL